MSKKKLNKQIVSQLFEETMATVECYGGNKYRVPKFDMVVTMKPGKTIEGFLEKYFEDRYNINRISKYVIEE
jgi:hypothetical protein